MLDVPVVHRGIACRLNMGTDVLARKNAEWYRCIGRAEGRGADSGDRAFKFLGEQRQTDDVAGLTLVGAHPERGVALEMLDQFVTLAHGKCDVAYGDIVLQIDEALGALASRGHAPERPQSTGRNGLCLWC